MRVKKIAFLLVLFSLTIMSCHQKEKIPEGTVWEKFIYEEYGGYLYVAHYNEKVHGILCFNYLGLQGHAILEHECTEEQYKKIPELLVQNLEATYVNSSEQPDLTDYPNLSMYLSFVMSSDELHEIWACLELEEHLYEE